MKTKEVDKEIIHWSKEHEGIFARAALFIVFFWFGILKVFNLSPANPLVESLLNKMIPFMSFETFIVLFGIFECGIGVLFLIRGAERIVLPLLGIHMITTFMPLLFLPEVAWLAPFVPSLEGQYILKNFVIIALAIGIASHLKKMK